MTEHREQAPAIAWVAVCLMALGIGFYAGEKFAPADHKLNAAPSNPASGIINDADGSTFQFNEHSIAHLIRAVGPSVVSIETKAQSESSELPNLMPGLLKQPESRVVGSGVIIRPDGYIVTSNHVIGLDKGIFVVFYDGRRLPAKVVGRDWLSSAAILKVDATDLPAANLGDSSKLEPGDWVVSIGSPMRLDHSASVGIVSAINRNINDVHLGGFALIQTDAAMNPGSSGGALCNIHGQVIGMNSAVRRDAQNISFAVPIDIVMQAADMLINDGSLAHAYLGIYMGPTGEAATPAAHDKGVYVLAVRQGPARAAGLEGGDIIKAFDEQPISDVSQLRRMLFNHKPGDSVSMVVSHKGATRTLTLTLGQSPADPPKN